MSVLSSLRRAVNEGAYWGAAYAIVVWFIAYIAVSPPGGVFDGHSPLQAEFWSKHAFLLSTLGSSVFFGSIQGIVLFYLNRWLLKFNSWLNQDGSSPWGLKSNGTKTYVSG
jgi:hypothetical protein